MLIFGNALHTVHPIAGQGLNMMLRDLCKLQNVIEKQIALGLDIGSSTLVTDFSDEIKSNNFVYSTGIDFLEKIFSVKNLTFKNFRNYYLKKIKKKKNFKFFFINLADKGII